MELYTNRTKFYFSWKYIFPLLLYLGMLGLGWLCLYIIMIELDQPDYWYIQEKYKFRKSIYTESMESCSLVISQILAEFHLERATYTTLDN